MAKYYDTTAVLQVIGCVFNDPTLLDMEDKYVLILANGDIYVTENQSDKKIGNALVNSVLEVLE